MRNASGVVLFMEAFAAVLETCSCGGSDVGLPLLSLPVSLAVCRSSGVSPCSDPPSPCISPEQSGTALANGQVAKSQSQFEKSPAITLHYKH